MAMAFFLNRGDSASKGACPRRRRTRGCALSAGVTDIPYAHPTAHEATSRKKDQDGHVEAVWGRVARHWLFLGAPSLLLRGLFARGRAPRRPSAWAAPLLHGTLQDGVVALQALAATAPLRRGRGPRRRRIAAALAAVAHCTVAPLLDALLWLASGPRLSWDFLANFRLNFRLVAPSFADAWSRRAVALALAWVAFVALGAARLAAGGAAGRRRRRRVAWEVPDAALLVAAGLGWVACLLSHARQDPSVMYYVDNSVFRLQLEPFRYALATVVGPDHARRHTKSVLEEQIVAASEIYMVPESLDGVAYPTLRKTLGYQGPKLFDIDVHDRRPPNVLLIMMESWKDLASLGADARRRITPEFDRLRAGGISFDAHYAPGVQTSRTLLVSLFGNLPEHEEEPAIGKYPDLNLVGLPHLMKAKGYHNEFISGSDLAWDKWNTRLLRHGFDKLLDKNAVQDLLDDKGYPYGEPEIGGLWGLWDEKSFNALYERLLELRAAKTPSFVNFYSVTSHWPFGIVPYDFEVPDLAPYDEVDSYDYLASVSYADAQLGRFVARCRAAGLFNDTLVLIQGDHGSSFARQTMPESVREEPTHVPALLLADGRLSADAIGTAVTQLSSQADTFATVADLLGLPPGGMWNHGIGSSMLRDYGPGGKIAILENPFHGKSIGARRGDMKFVQQGSTTLAYNISADPTEERPLSTYDIAAATALLDRTRQTVNLYSSLYQRNGFAPEDLAALDP